MGKRVRGAMLVVAAGATTVLWVASGAAQGDVSQMSGVWKLNVEASTNPNGPAAPARGTGRVDRPQGDGADGGELGKEEQARFNAIKGMFFKAPPMMAIQATPTEFKMLLDPQTKQGYAHTTDNKKQSLQTPAGPADFKTKWDGKKLRREVETKDTYHMVEEFVLSADGSQIIVTLKADSRMVRDVQTGAIRRVYDRQKP
jgi:hypothetical protein